MYIHPFVLIFKRLLDIFGALFGLLITALIFPIIALIIKTTSPGPIFYTQMRVGRTLPEVSELFMLVKFRTMRMDAEKFGAQWATKDDPRIYPFGRIMRKTRLDELPQLWNVLKGDMSLIGPRPERPSFVGKLEHQIPFYLERMYGVKPGITGLAQVYLGYDEDIEDVRRKVAFDHSYAASMASPLYWLGTEFKVIFMTLWVMVARRGQ